MIERADHLAPLLVEPGLMDHLLRPRAALVDMGQQAVRNAVGQRFQPLGLGALGRIAREQLICPKCRFRYCVMARLSKMASPSSVISTGILPERIGVDEFGGSCRGVDDHRHRARCRHRLPPCAPWRCRAKPVHREALGMMRVFSMLLIELAASNYGFVPVAAIARSVKPIRHAPAASPPSAGGRRAGRPPGMRGRQAPWSCRCALRANSACRRSTAIPSRGKLWIGFQKGAFGGVGVERPVAVEPSEFRRNATSFRGRRAAPRNSRSGKGPRSCHACAIHGG